MSNKHLVQFKTLSMLGQVTAFIEQMYLQTKKTPYVQVLSFNTHYQLIIGNAMLEIAIGGNSYNRITYIERSPLKDCTYKIIDSVSQIVSGKGTLSLLGFIDKLQKAHMNNTIDFLFHSSQPQALPEKIVA